MATQAALPSWLSIRPDVLAIVNNILVKNRVVIASWAKHFFLIAPLVVLAHLFLLVGAEAPWLFVLISFF
jgi:hypothetical protein